MLRILKSKVVILILISGVVAALLTVAIAFQLGIPAALGALAFFNTIVLSIPYWRTREVLAQNSRRVNEFNRLANLSATSNINHFKTLEAKVSTLNRLFEKRPLPGTQIGFSSEMLIEIQEQNTLIKDQLNAHQALLQELLISLDLRVSENNPKNSSYRE